MVRKKILIADDDRIIRHTMAKALYKVDDYHIDFVRNGIEATYRMDGSFYDLVITEYKMPHMNGLELTRWINVKFPSVPILVITADGPIKEFQKSGAFACLAKPFNVHDLQIMVQSILDLPRAERIELG